MAQSVSLQGSWDACSAGIEAMAQWEFGLVDDYVDMNRSRRCLHATVVMIRYHRSMSCYSACGGKENARAPAQKRKRKKRTRN